MVKRLAKDRCCGAIIDVQELFLAKLPKAERSRIESGTRHLVALLGALRIPVFATIERPVKTKGGLPKRFGALRVFEKDHFDMTREKDVLAHLERLLKPQIVVAGCETDVCVLESVLGLRELGHEVFVVEDLVFSSSPDTRAAVKRMRVEGAVMLSFKTLFHELLEVREGAPGRMKVSVPDEL